jgi:hypothetical protein
LWAPELPSKIFSYPTFGKRETKKKKKRRRKQIPCGTMRVGSHNAYVHNTTYRMEGRGGEGKVKNVECYCEVWRLLFLANPLSQG